MFWEHKQPGKMKLPHNHPLKQLDHLVYTAPSVEVGMDEMERILGVRPIPGGRHPDFGTHNALLSLGPTTYLEVIAPDPALDTGENNILFKAYFDEVPRLSRWVLRTEEIEKLTASAASSGLDLGAVVPGSREKPDGSVLSWKLTDPRIIPLDGAVPFLISWGNTSHPARALPAGGELIGFSIEHPSPAKVKKSLALLGLKTDIVQADKIRLVATIKTVNSQVVLF